jgi:hypothetical protein
MDELNRLRENRDRRRDASSAVQNVEEFDRIVRQRVEAALRNHPFATPENPNGTGTSTTTNTTASAQTNGTNIGQRIGGSRNTRS